MSKDRELMRDGAPCEFNKMGSDGYPFCASSTEIMRLREQNTKLRKLSIRMAKALGVRSDWCTTDCAREFKCSHMDECPIDQELHELLDDVGYSQGWNDNE